VFSLLKNSVPVCFAFLSLAASAGDPHFMPAGAGQAGMAYVSVMKNDFWSAFHNQACLTGINRFMTGLNYENRFGIPELGTSTAALIVPVSRATLGVIYSNFGCRDFRRQMTGVACSVPLSSNMSAGIQIDHFSEKSYGEYSTFHTVTFEAGIAGIIYKKVRFGVHLFNPVPASLRKREMISGLRAGAGFEPGKGLFAGVETEFTTDGKVDLRTGFEYELSKSLMLRGGFRTQHSSFCLGIGYRIRSAVIDIAFSTHDKLGITSSFSIVFNIK
jgi:hypothetical protein